MAKMDLPHHCTRVDVTEYGSIRAESDGRWIMSNYLSSSDYADSVCRSNARVFARDFAASENTWWRWAGQSIVIRTLAYRNIRDVRETLDALDDYPLLDDSDHSDLEQEEQQEDWESWARDDFKRELVKELGELLESRDTDAAVGERATDRNGRDADEVIDQLSDEQIDVLFWTLCGQEGSYPEGSGQDVSWPLVDMAHAWLNQTRRSAGSWYTRKVPLGCVPGFDENGRVTYHTGEPCSWYPAFDLPVCCPRCDHEHVVGTCSEHVDCLTDESGTLGKACESRLVAHASVLEHPCTDPDCSAVHEARRIFAERELRKPGAQQPLFGACA